MEGDPLRASAEHMMRVSIYARKSTDQNIADEET